MNMKDIVKAWRNPAYRSQMAEVPENPAGIIELSGTDLEIVGGGCGGGCGTKSTKHTKGTKGSKGSKGGCCGLNYWNWR